MAADETNARLMLLYGDEYPLTGKKFGIKDMLLAEQMGRGEREVLQVTRVRYVVLDRRLISWNNMLGLYFARPGDQTPWDTRKLGPEPFAKFDEQKGVNRLFDSGDTVIYDVGALSGVP